MTQERHNAGAGSTEAIDDAGYERSPAALPATLAPGSSLASSPGSSDGGLAVALPLHPEATAVAMARPGSAPASRGSSDPEGASASGSASGGGGSPSGGNQISTKRGFPVYRTNPSVPTAGIQTRSKRFHVPGGKASVILDHSSGEIKGLGGMGFWWEEEVDTSRFVKLFLDGIKQAADLSKTGMQVFELVYHAMRANPGSDEIKLNQYLARDHGLSDRTYQRGVRELLEKEFLYRSPSDGVFFVNIRFMFNGDRLAFVRSYHLKAAPEHPRQGELALLQAPPAPDGDSGS